MAVIVNDMCEVNIDARLVRGGDGVGMRAYPAVWWTDYEQRDGWQAEQRARDQAMLSAPDG